jgi:hypothetical protein
MPFCTGNAQQHLDSAPVLFQQVAGVLDQQALYLREIVLLC